MKRKLFANFPPSRIRRFLREERGTIAVMSGVVVLASLGALAVGVDSASLFVERRRAQGAVDLAAIAAARDLPRAEAAARATIKDNDVPDVQNVILTTGNYTADPDLPPEPTLPSDSQVNWSAGRSG